MGARGPKPKPNVVHLANGNPSKKRFSDLQNGLRMPVEIPDAPQHLKGEARAEWDRITPELLRLGLIAKVDRAALMVYCQAYALYVRAQEKIDELGEIALIQSTTNGYEQIGPWMQLSNRAADQMKSFLSEFGMTPSARTRVNVTPQMDLFGDGEETEGDEKKSPAARYLTK